jgi:hypothetical protein
MKACLGVQGFVPLRAEDPRQRGHSATQKAQPIVVKLQVLPSVRLLDSTCLLRRASIDGFLPFAQRFLAALESAPPALMPVPPDLVPELAIGVEDLPVVATQ